MSVTPETAVQSVKTAIEAASLTRATGDAALLNVVDFDPTPGNLETPGQVSVTFGGMNEVTYFVVVRLWSFAGADIQAAEKFCRSTVPTVDLALDAVAVPRSAWGKVFSDEFFAYVCETNLEFPRDDF